MDVEEQPEDGKEMGERGEEEATEASAQTQEIECPHCGSNLTVAHYVGPELEAWRSSDPAEDLSERSVPEFEIRIISYLDENGEEMYGMCCTDGVRMSSAVGLLQMVGHVWHHRIMEEDEDQ